MPHFRVDDGFDGHPKTVRAGDDALGMWVRAGAWCMRYLTDGFVPEWWVKQQPKGVAKAKKLVAAELWDDGTEKDGEKGYQFHEFVGPGRQDSREKIEADREFARRRKQKSRGLSQGESHRDDHRDDHRESQGESRRSPGYTQPNPTQPISNPLVDSSGEVTQVEPPQRCPSHPSGTEKPCGACADARRTHDAWQAARRENELIDRRRIREARDACGLCDENGMRPARHGLARCDHEETANG